MNQRQQAIAKVAFVLLAALGITGCASIATKEVVATKEAPAAIGHIPKRSSSATCFFSRGRFPLIQRRIS